MGAGRSAAILASARPPPVDPVNPAAATAGCWSSLSPACTPWIRPNVPAGAPAEASAPAAISAVRSEVTGCPSCALTTTGQPAASAEEVSPPATENANGKFDAANTATGPTGRLIRRRSGTTPWAVVTTASRYPGADPGGRPPQTPPRASSASATASSASARRPNADQAGNADTAAATVASTPASVVSGTGSPTGSPVRGSNA